MFEVRSAAVAIVEITMESVAARHERVIRGPLCNVFATRECVARFDWKPAKTEFALLAGELQLIDISRPGMFDCVNQRCHFETARAVELIRGAVGSEAMSTTTPSLITARMLR